ncbi:MAG: hypothetical protein JWQ29_2551 [Phenylobacterium sp.]|nr:hypothetical protein [Phenylobacterium sp.]
MNQAFLIQTAASAAAVALLVGLAAWAKIARPGAPLDEARALKLLAEDFPGRAIDELWVAVDGKGALARSGASALVLCELGDGYVARQIPWAQALAASFRDGRITVDLADIGAPKAVISLAAWPPKGPPTDIAA